MLPKTYDRWSDEAKEERMRQNRILWDPSVIANQGNRSVSRIRQTISTTYRSRSETRMHQPNQELSNIARSRSETRENVNQDRQRPCQLDQLPQRSTSETRNNPRIQQMVTVEKGTRSRSEDRAPSAKTVKEPIDIENRRGREEDRRMPSQVRKSARIKRKENEQEVQHTTTGGNSCGHCSKKVANGVHCKMCLNWYHFSCEGTTEKELKARYKTDEDDYVCLKHKVHLDKEKTKNPASSNDASCRQEGVDFTVNLDVLRKVPSSSESSTHKENPVCEIEEKGRLIDANEDQANMGEHKDNDPPINNKRKSVKKEHEVKSEGLSTRKETVDESEESVPIITEEGIESKVGKLDPVESTTEDNEKEQIAETHPTKASLVTDNTESSLREEKESEDNTPKRMLTTTIIPDRDPRCDNGELGDFQSKDVQQNTNAPKLLKDERKENEIAKKAEATGPAVTQNSTGESTNGEQNELGSSGPIINTVIKVVAMNNSKEPLVGDESNKEDSSRKLRELISKLFLQSSEKDKKIRRLEEEIKGKSSIASSNSCQQCQQNLLRAFLLEGNIVKTKEQYNITKASYENKISKLEDNLTKMKDIAKQDADIKASQSKEIKAYETLQRKQVSQIEEMKKEITEQAMKMEQIMEVNKALEVDLQKKEKESSNAQSMLPIEGTITDIRNAVNTDQNLSTPTLDSRFQNLRNSASAARQCNNIQGTQNTGKEKSLEERLKRLADSGNSDSDKPTSSETQSYLSSATNGSSDSNKSEWLNFNSKNIKGPNISNRSLTEDNPHKNLPECFGCRKQGHVIRDCTLSMNLSISSKNKDGELTKHGLRRTFSKYGNISSVRVNSNNYSAFVCFSKREQGEKLISDWKNTREINDLWNIEAYRGERVKCYNCGRNGHRASECNRPTKAPNAGGRNQHQTKQGGSIPPDLFDQGSYIIEGQHTDSEDLSHKECITNIPPDFFGQQISTNEASQGHQLKELQSQMNEVKEILQTLLKQREN